MSDTGLCTERLATLGATLAAPSDTCSPTTERQREPCGHPGCWQFCSVGRSVPRSVARAPTPNADTGSGFRRPPDAVLPSWEEAEGMAGGIQHDDYALGLGLVFSHATA